MKKINITNNPNTITDEEIEQHCHSGLDPESSENINNSGLRIKSAMTKGDEDITNHRHFDRAQRVEKSIESKKISRLCPTDSARDDGIKEVKSQIGENLFKIRRERGISLHAAATLIEIKRSRLDWLERGSGCMNLPKLIRLANFYKIPLADLFK